MIKRILNTLESFGGKINDTLDSGYYTEFSNLVITAKATRNIVSDINVMLLQIMNHEPINTKWEKINSLTFKDIDALSSFISVMCTSAQDELYNAKARLLDVSNNHTLSNAESSMYALCNELLSSLNFVKLYLKEVNKHPENWSFNSIESFSCIIYYMNQTLIDYFDKELNKIAT